MILKSELTGLRLRKSLHLMSASYRYHNKNQTGGNFAINLINKRYDMDNYELSGYYNTEGKIVHLRFGGMYRLGTKYVTVAGMTYADLIDTIKAAMDRLEVINNLN